MRTASISGRKTVKSNSANNPSLQPNGTEPGGKAFISPVRLLDGVDDDE